jgi:hypothetical protein
MEGCIQYVKKKRKRGIRNVDVQQYFGSALFFFADRDLGKILNVDPDTDLHPDHRKMFRIFYKHR